MPISENAILTDKSAPESIALTTSCVLWLITPKIIDDAIKK